jgi:cytochrome b561
MSTSELHTSRQPFEFASSGAYPPISKVLHWLTAGLVALLVITGVTMKQIGEGPAADQLYTLHKTIGALALFIIVSRLAYRVGAMLRGRWRRSSGEHAIHAVLYAVMLIVPLFGWAGVSDFGVRGILFDYSLPAIWPEGAGYADALFAAHAYAAFGFLALVSLHIGIAMDHYVKRGRECDAPASEH